MIRILGGSIRGRKLKSPKGLLFRPATGRVKEFIFSYLYDEIEGLRILDLFSGTGSLGIEALSRGAKECVFVEKSRESLKILKDNIDICRFSGKAHILAGDVFSVIKKLGSERQTFDIIMADPPFKLNLRKQIVVTVGENNILNNQGLLFVEHEQHDEDADQKRLKLIKSRRFGHCVVSIYQ